MAQADNVVAMPLLFRKPDDSVRTGDRFSDPHLPPLLWRNQLVQCDAETENSETHTADLTDQIRLDKWFHRRPRHPIIGTEERKVGSTGSLRKPFQPMMKLMFTQCHGVVSHQRHQLEEIGRAHVCTPVTWPPRMPPS